MKIFDCFMYLDEDLLLDLRFNYLDKYVDYFVVVESKFNHKGEVKKLKFEKKNFQKFENKIIHIIQEQEPDGIEEINSNESIIGINQKYILNAGRRENAQRNTISKGLKKANKDDLDTKILQDYNKLIKSNPKLETILLPIRDGLSLSRKL